MTAPAKIRLRRIRYKDGRTLSVFHPKSDGIAQKFSDTAANCISRAPDIAGFALVAWRPNGEIFTSYQNGPRSLVPGGGIPQYVKDILVAEMAASWANQD